jgi:hypothetical protein
MHLYRKQDLSVTYFLKDLFSAETFIRIEDAFPDGELQLPTISVEADDTQRVPFEMGNRVGQRNRIWFIDVFAKNKAQRDEIGYRIFDAIELGIPVYDYDEGFPPSVSPTEIGSLEILDLTARVIRILPQLTEKLYWRITISFSTRYNPVTT